jgi:predicted phosphate transport protein (TIGR00153 family)
MDTISLLAEKPENINPIVIKTKIEMVSIYESSADDAYFKSLLEVSKGAFFSDLRGDFIRLFESIDNIADAAKNSSKVITRVKLDQFMTKLSREEKYLSLFLGKIVECVEILRETIIYLYKDIDTVIERSIKVKELEEEADDIKWKLLEMIFCQEYRKDLLSLFELKEFVLTLDEIADAAAYASEILIIIVTKVRG